MQDNFTKRNMVPMLNEMIQVRAKYLGIPPNLIKWIVFDRDQNADWLQMLRKSEDEVEFCTAIKHVIRQWEAGDHMLVSAKTLGRKTWLDCVRRSRAMRQPFRTYVSVRGRLRLTTGMIVWLRSKSLCTTAHGESSIGTLRTG